MNITIHIIVMGCPLKELNLGPSHYDELIQVRRTTTVLSGLWRHLRGYPPTRHRNSVLGRLNAHI